MTRGLGIAYCQVSRIAFIPRTEIANEDVRSISKDKPLSAQHRLYLLGQLSNLRSSNLQKGGKRREKMQKGAEWVTQNIA